MSKEIIDLLESLNIRERADDIGAFQKEGDLSFDQKEAIKRFSCLLHDARKKLDQALTLLRQQPTASEFTERLRKFVKMYEQEVPRRAETTFLKEACNIIDSSEASRKDLCDACEYTETLLSKGIGQRTHALALVEAAIAKDKKVGE